MITNRDDVGIAIRYAFLRKATQQKFSLVALIIISILLLYIDSFDNKPLNTTKSIIKDIIYRGSIVVSFPGKIFINYVNRVEDHFGLYQENLKLREENIVLKESLYTKEFLTVENLELKKLLNQEMSSSSVLKSAKVIVDKNSPFLKSIILNKGFREKIKKGMAILDGKYFIGRVVEVNYFSSRVLLISDLNSKIPVVVEPKGYHAILSGTGKENPILDFLPKNHKIESGNIVYTSGKDGIFSSGIPIGQTLLDDSQVIVSPFSDFNQLSYVSIDLNISTIDEDK